MMMMEMMTTGNKNDSWMTMKKPTVCLVLLLLLLLPEVLISYQSPRGIYTWGRQLLLCCTKWLGYIREETVSPDLQLLSRLSVLR